MLKCKHIFWLQNCEPRTHMWIPLHSGYLCRCYYVFFFFCPQVNCITVIVTKLNCLSDTQNIYHLSLQKDYCCTNIFKISFHFLLSHLFPCFSLVLGKLYSILGNLCRKRERVHKPLSTTVLLVHVFRPKCAKHLFYTISITYKSIPIMHI